MRDRSSWSHSLSQRGSYDNRGRGGEAEIAKICVSQMLCFLGRGETLQEPAQICENLRLGSVWFVPFRFVPWGSPWTKAPWETDFYPVTVLGRIVLSLWGCRTPAQYWIKNRAPMGPEILSSAGAGVWRKAPMAFPDSSSVLYNRPNCLLQCLPNCLLFPHQQGLVSLFQNYPQVRAIARQFSKQGSTPAPWARGLRDQIQKWALQTQKILYF